MSDVQERCWLNTMERDELKQTRSGRIAVTAVDALLREHEMLEGVLAECRRGQANLKADIRRHLKTIGEMVQYVPLDEETIRRCVYDAIPPATTLSTSEGTAPTTVEGSAVVALISSTCSRGLHSSCRGRHDYGDTECDCDCHTKIAV